MTLISSIALLFFILLGYSLGATIIRPGKRNSPGPIDFISILVLWVVAFITRTSLNKWLAILIWLSISILVGLLVTKLQQKQKSIADPFEPPLGQSTWWKLVWLHWLHFSSRLGNYQSRALLTFLYFSVVLPFGLALRLFGDPLGTRKTPPVSVWHAWTMSSKTIDEARRQF